MAAEDLDGDGALDLAVAEIERNEVAILLGDGNGTFAETTPRPLVTQAPRAIRIADLDGDGIPDLVTANGTGSISLLRGNGDGSFMQEERFLAGVSAASIALADLDGDGLLDAAVADEDSGSITLLLSR